MLWSQQTIHMIDFEGDTTTGIVEFGIVTVFQGNITGTISRLCRAQKAIPKESSLVHGIYTEDVLNSAPFAEEWQRFVQLRRKGLFAAHHARYENKLLKSTWSHPPYCPNFVEDGKSLAEWGPWIDTHPLYIHLIPKFSSYKLSALVQHLGLQDELDKLAMNCCPTGRNRYHCALYDALAAALLLLKVDDLQANASLRWLALYSRRNPMAHAQGELSLSY